MNAVITGAGRGLGLALVTRYGARSGGRVFAVAREPDQSTELQAAVAANAGRIEPIRLDLAQADAGERLAQAIGPGPIDLLINNAGAMDEQEFGELTQAELIDQFIVNAFAPVLVTQALRSRLGSGAKVVNMSSVLGSIARAGAPYLAYSMSKAALNMFSKKLAAELEDAAVLALHPGWVRTRMGGDDATLTVDQSADGMVRVIDAFERSRSGQYLAYDGSTLPW